MNPFSSSELKIKRAKGHITDLNNAVSTFLKRKPYRIVAEGDPKFGPHELVIRVREDIPCDFPLFIGDAVHNLRAALDLMACDLVRLNNGDIQDVYFPFAKSGRDDLEHMIKQRHVDRASPDVVELIRSFKPYKGGNDALYAIHEMDIMDKHQLLIPVAYFAGLPDMVIRHGTTASLTLRDCNIGPIADGTKVMALPHIANMKVGQEIKASFKIIFGYGHFGVEPVIPTLHQLTQLVDGIVKTFKTHCLGP